MQRTTIMLPPPLKARAARRARKLGISLGELIRRSLESTLRDAVPSPQDDSLFGDHEVYGGEVPTDLSEDHDRHLYGPKME